MNQNSKTADWVPVNDGYMESVLPSRVGPYETSLAGEYTRLLLLLISLPLVVWFGGFVMNHQTGVLCLAASITLLLTVITSRGYPGVRITLLLIMMANVLALAISGDDPLGKKIVRPGTASVTLLLISLGTACAFEFVAIIQSCTRSTLLKTVAWGLFLTPAMVFVFGIPLLEAIWNALEGDEKKKALQDPNWGLLNEAAFRSAKLAAFGILAYMGACFGSFLNVVAYCVPRGEAIGLRDSCCPKCEAKIRRIDNLPIFSYINLGARCRSCHASISPRYLIVEIVVGVIFGSLFLYELITGCQNVPLMKVYHQGILWVILYPKWPAIGIYFYHAFFMCIVLVLSLMESDEHPLKPLFATVMAISFVAAAALYHPIQPVPLLEHVSGLTISLSPLTDQILKLLLGGIVGAGIGRMLVMMFSTSRPAYLTFAFCLTGVVLGWQALIQVVIVFAIASLAVRFVPSIRRLTDSRPTTMLLVAILLHHPFWKTIADLWRF